MINDIDFLRYLIDLIDSKKNNQSSATPDIVINIDKDGNAGYEPEPEEVETAMDRDDIFIPPLQAKIEMMKKMTGVEPKNQDLLASDDDEPLDV